MTRPQWMFTIVLLAAASTMVAAAKKENPMSPIKDDPNLPRVLLIGDSISIGYTLPTRHLLAGKANVHRPRTNCGPTTRGLEHIDEWLGDGHWDVIHFNWGLHDLKYIAPDSDKLTRVDAPGARQQVPIDEYEKNLEKLVQRLKKTGAKLIWRNTTPCPPGNVGRVVGDSVKYNQAALRVMKKYDVPVQDMYTFVMEHPDTQRKANVHFTSEGSKALAETNVVEIEKYLPKK